jgi:hypothetical protein
MPIDIKAPDGSIARFPDGMSDAAITAVMRQHYPPPSDVSIRSADEGSPGPSRDLGADLNSAAGGAANVLREANKGLTLGASPRIYAGVEALTGLGGKQGDYSGNLANENAKSAAFQQEHPLFASGANAAGAAVAGLALPLGPLARAAQAAGPLARTAIGGAIGGSLGGAQGAVSSPDYTNLPEVLANASRGAGIGGVFGAAVPAGVSVARGAGSLLDELINPADRMLSRAVDGVPAQTFNDAQALMENGRNRGVQLTPNEAVQSASGGAADLGRMQRLVEGTTGGGAVFRPMMAQRPGQVSGAFNDVLNRIAPPTNQPGVIGTQGQEAAQGALATVRQGINTATAPMYAAAENQTIDPHEFATIARDPAFQESLQRLRSNPVLGPRYAAMPANSIGVLDAVTKDMVARGQSLSNAANPGFQPQESAAYGAGAANARNIARNPATGGSAAYDLALTAQEQARRQNLNPLEAGPLGAMAGSPKLDAQTGALFPRDPAEGAGAETATAIGHLNAQDAALAPQLARQHLSTAFSQSTGDNISGANQWGGAKFAKEVAGAPLRADALNRGLAALPNGATVAPDVAGLLDVLRATGMRQAPGSLTAQNAIDLKALGAPGALGVAKGALNVPTALKNLSEVFTRARLEGRSADLARNFTNRDPASAIDFLRNAQRPAATPPADTTAGSAIAALLASHRR